MEYFPEDVLRDYGDEPTNLMLDLWHKECLKQFKNDIEVIMVDRRHNPQLRDIPGTVNSASPCVFDNKMHLALWLESVYPLEPVLVTHELGHWILALRGFKRKSGNSEAWTRWKKQTKLPAHDTAAVSRWKAQAALHDCR